MNDLEIIPAKATRPEEQSDAIVVSFTAESHEHLLGNRFSVVIRKRVPKSASYRWLYFHLKQPIGAICARAPIAQIFHATPKEAVVLAKQIHLPPAEIIAYIANGATIGCYELGPFQFATKPITTSNLAARMVYHPPQSFFIISKNAKAAIDQLAGFSNTKANRPASTPQT